MAPITWRNAFKSAGGYCRSLAAALSRSDRLVILLFLLTFGIRLLVLVRISQSPFFLPEAGDMKFYNDWALRIAKGELTDGHAFYGLPGYAYLLGAIYSVVGFDPFLVGLLQCLSEAGIAVLIFKIALNLFPAGRPVGAMAAIGWAFYQPAQAFSTILMPTTWLVLTFWGCVYWLLKSKTDSTWKPWLPMGFVIGLCATVIATIFALLPLIVCRLVARVDRKIPLRAKVRYVCVATAILFFGVAAGTSPAWIHNFFLVREPVLLSAHSGLNFFIGNNPIANGYPKLPPGLSASQTGMLYDSIRVAELESGRSLSRVEVSKFWSERARSYILSDFPGWLRLIGTKAANFWNAFQYDDLSLVTLFAQDDILIPGFRFGLVAALALAGAFVAVTRAPASRWIIAAVLLHMAMLLPVFVTERYRLAAVPGLLLLACFGIVFCHRCLLEQKWRAVGAYGCSAACAAAFVAWPQTDPGLWSLDYYNTGLKFTQAGDLARAQINLEKAYAYVSDNSEINFALGNLWLEKGDRYKAKWFYRDAMEINPYHVGACNNLAVIAMEEERWPVAAAFLERSIALDAADAKRHYLLARALFAGNDFQQARKRIDVALKLDPDVQEFHQLQNAIEQRLVH